MAWLLTEDLIAAIETYLTANFAAKASAINTEIGDGNNISAPTRYYRSDIPEIPKPPVCVLMGKWAGSFRSMTLSGTGHVSGVHEVIIRIYAFNSDRDKLANQLYRYGRAVGELLLEAEGADALGGFIIGADDPDLEVDPPAIQDGTALLMGFVDVTSRYHKLETKTT